MAREPRFIRSIQSQSQGQVLAVDVGSTSTKIKLGNKILFDEPTCIAIHRGSQAVVAVGQKAYQLIGKNTSHIEVVFPIQHATPASTRHFEFFLQAISSQLQLKRSWLSQLAGNQLVVGMSDSLSPVEKGQFLKSLKSSQLGKVIPMSAAVAAATNLKRLQTDSSPVCLVHIGGQTTQITVIGGGEVAASQKYHLGGIQFTEAVQESIRINQQCGVSWHLAETIKKEIAFVDSPIIPRTVKQRKMSVQGKDITTQLGKTVVVAAADFMPGFSTILSDLLVNIQLFFSELQTELATTAIASGLVLTGGGSSLTGLGEYLSAELHTEVFVSPTPAIDVINGLLPNS